MSIELKILREEKSITRKQMAEVLNISERTLEAYEQGRRKTACMELQTALAIADFFGIDVRELACFD